MQAIVSFYNTPLSALHKVLASFLKPLAQNRLRFWTLSLKDHILEHVKLGWNWISTPSCRVTKTVK